MVYQVVCFEVFVALMLTSIPAIYTWFNVEPAGTRRRSDRDDARVHLLEILSGNSIAEQNNGPE